MRTYDLIKKLWRKALMEKKNPPPLSEVLARFDPEGDANIYEIEQALKNKAAE